MTADEIKAVVSECIEDLVVPTFLKMLQESEKRIDATNTMIQRLSETCAKNIDVYDKHLTSLEASRDRAQSNSASSLDISRNLTTLLQEIRDDYTQRMSIIDRELKEARREQIKLTEAYTRLAEGSRGAHAEIKL